MIDEVALLKDLKTYLKACEITQEKYQLLLNKHLELHSDGICSNSYYQKLVLLSNDSNSISDCNGRIYCIKELINDIEGGKFNKVNDHAGSF
jgi:hypothetical protein